MTQLLIILCFFPMKVPSDKVTLFDEFEKYYVPLHMKGGYKKAILAVLKVHYVRQETPVVCSYIHIDGCACLVKHWINITLD